MPSEQPKIMWQPSERVVTDCNLTRFVAVLEDRWKVNLSDYHQVYKWSVQEPEQFWESVWDFCEVRYSQRFEQVVDRSKGIRNTSWFPGARLNFAENLLRTRNDTEAVVFWNETGFQRRLTYAQLWEEVEDLAAALRTVQLGPGERVAAIIPNMPEAIVGMLATTALGGVWTSCSPDFATQGILDRFGQVEPKILFAVDGYRYKGKSYPIGDKLAKIAQAIPSIEKVVVIPYLNESSDRAFPERAVSYQEFLSTGVEGGLSFQQLPPDHPVYIMYSSGTTGVPKCMVHGAGGTLLEHLKELVLHTDLRPDDRLFYATTCGWMMWNWLVSGLATGASVMLYDGYPFAEDGEILFRFAQEECISIFGTSAGFLSAVEKAGLKPASAFDLSELRSMLSTGSPLLEENFDFVEEYVGQHIQLSSIAGGTDIIGCFVLGCPLLPVYRGEIQARSLGLAVDVFDEEGNSIVDQTGELVCTAPFPSMPVKFWNDPEGTRYHEAYFSVFEEVWRHGDFAQLTARGGMRILGRSDATLNPGGVRIGTAEIYRAIERISEVQDSIVVGHRVGGDEEIILFVVMQSGQELTEPLKAKIVSEMPSPRHRPAQVIAVPAIPVTRSGKKVEIAVRQIIHGQEPKNVAALANPDSLEIFKGLHLDRN